MGETDLWKVIIGTLIGLVGIAVVMVLYFSFTQSYQIWGIPKIEALAIEKPLGYAGGFYAFLASLAATFNTTPESVATKLMAIPVAVGEEGIFRGLIPDILRPYLKDFSYLASSLLFGLFHAGTYGSIALAMGAFAAGVVLSMVRMQFGLLPAISAHLLYNLSAG
jgi:membrane protease YdiL (CAAX protease family)